MDRYQKLILGWMPRPCYHALTACYERGIYNRRFILADAENQRLSAVGRQPKGRRNLQPCWWLLSKPASRCPFAPISEPKANQSHAHQHHRPHFRLGYWADGDRAVVRPTCRAGGEAGNGEIHIL
jgi:hypothetical protein